MDFEELFHNCFRQHLREREPDCAKLSIPEVDQLIFEYNRFLRLKYYIYCQREIHKVDMNTEELEKYYPLLLAVPPLILLAWERHLLWTQSYRTFCINKIGHFIERVLYTEDDDLIQAKEVGYATLRAMYSNVFGPAPPVLFWPTSDITRESLPSVQTLTIYPSFDTIVAKGIKDPSCKSIESLATACGFDVVEKFDHYLFPAEFQAPFKAFLCDKEPSIRALSDVEYDQLVIEYIKFMIVMKTVVIGRDEYDPSLTKKDIDYL